jgi:hypothetical protein
MAGMKQGSWILVMAFMAWLAAAIYFVITGEWREAWEWVTANSLR